MSENIKIFFPTDSEDWHGVSGEWLWASNCGGNRFIIENIPINVYGISYHDIVSAVINDDQVLQYRDVVEKGGHSLYRIIINRGYNVDDFRKRWKMFEDVGCSYESNKNPERVFAINVPPDADVYFVYDLLEQGVEDGVWDFEEANFEHSLRD